MSAIFDNESNTVNLVDTLEPPTIATSGRAGLSNALLNASNSLTSKGPAQAVGAYFATPWVLACALWAVPNASITKISQRLASCLASTSSFFFSPSLKRTFSNTTSSPEATSTPER